VTQLLEGLTFTDTEQEPVTQPNGVDKDEMLKLQQKELEEQKKRIAELEKANVGEMVDNEVCLFSFPFPFPFPIIDFICWHYSGWANVGL